MGATQSHFDAEKAQNDPAYMRSERTGMMLFCHEWWSSEEAPRAMVILSHGVGEHIRRYDHLAAELNSVGVLLAWHDHQGHGRSEGYPVDIDSFDSYVADLIQHSKAMQRARPGIPLFLFGHSMGGEIAILTAHAAPSLYVGALFSAPAILPDPATATPVRLAMAKIFATILPRLEVGNVDPSFVSRNPKTIADYQADPLVYHGGMRTRWAVNALKGMDDIAAFMHDVRYPFLMLQGTQDRLVNAEGAIRFHDAAQSEDKTIILYEGFSHELINEPEEDAKRVLKDIVTWITARI